RGANTARAEKLYRAAKLRCHTVDLREPQPAALANFLGGEERLQCPLEHLAGHPDTVILNSDAHIVARLQFSQVRTLDIARGDPQASAFRHRIPGIDRKIED